VVTTCRRLLPIIKVTVADIAKKDVSIELSRYKFKKRGDNHYTHSSFKQSSKEGVIALDENRVTNEQLDAECDFRNNNAEHIMSKRWEWVQNNPEKYVNLMRKGGMKDERIQDCLNGTCPLDFADPAQFQKCQGSLRELGRKLHKIITDAGVKVEHPVFRVIQQGSSIPGYSSNPRKGRRYVPNYLYDATKGSDTDFRVVLSGLKEYVQILRTKGTASRPGPIKIETKSVYPDMVEPDSAAKVFPELGAWIEEWQKIMKTEIQITMNMKSDDPAFEPKEWDNEAVSLRGVDLGEDILTANSKKHLDEPLLDDPQDAIKVLDKRVKKVNDIKGVDKYLARMKLAREARAHAGRRRLTGSKLIERLLREERAAATRVSTNLCHGH